MEPTPPIEPLPAFPTPMSLLRVLALGPQLVNGLLRATGKVHAAMDEFIGLVGESRELVGELRTLVDKVEDITDFVTTRMDGADLDELVTRVQRVEEAIINTEVATINLDKAFEGSVESLPGFLTRRARREGTKIDPTTVRDAEVAGP